ncbi:MAG: YfhO family protein, partial [Deltaproteobacteria bacterium]
SLLLPVELLSVLYPIILKIPYINPIVSFLFSTPVTLHARGIYLGALPVLLATVGIWVGIRTKFRKNGIFALLVLLYFIFNIIPISKIHPFFDLLTARYWTIYLFCLPILSAIVLEHLFCSSHIEKLRCVTRIFLFFIILPITFLSLFVSLFRSQIVGYALSQTGKISGMMGRDVLQGDVRLRISENLGDIFNLVSITSPFIWIPLFVVLGFYCLLCFREKISLYWQGMVIFLFLLIDCFLIGSKFRPTVVSQNELFKESSVTSFLKKGEGIFRFASLQGEDVLLKPNLGIFYGLYDVGGQESLLDRRYLVFSRRALQKKMGDAVTGSGILDFKDIDLKLAGMLHVKYLLQGERDFLFGDLKPVFRAEGINIYENPYFFPKAFLVQNYRVITEEEGLLHALTDLQFDPKKELLLEEEPLQRPAPRPFALGMTQLVDYSPNKVELITDSKEEAYLVLSDTYYPGWKATVDGKEEKIYRANGVLRAISVPGGKHLVQFLYRPKTLLIGGLFSIATFVLVVGIWLISTCQPFGLAICGRNHDARS